MKKSIPLFSLSLLGSLFTSPSVASHPEVNLPKSEQGRVNQLQIPHLSEVELPVTQASLLTQSSNELAEGKGREIISSEKISDNNSEQDSEIQLEVIGEKDALPESTPIHVVDQEEIRKQGASSVADVLKRMPGFAINDVGHGADIHTGTYYRGASINQSVILINGRQVNVNVNTYHGATDLNSIPVEAIDRVELYSGAASSLYGSSAVGGVINIITKQGSGKPRLNTAVEFGSLNLNNQQASFSGGTENVRYNFSFERFFIDNKYPVPVGAANRDANGNLFNADTATSTYFGNIAVDLNPKNTLSFDVKKLSSRRGLVYFGFPLQKDRLDHDGLNMGLSWRSQLAENSRLTTTFGFNQDFFNTYGPTVFGGVEYYRTGTLDTKQYTARLDHEWKITPNYQLRWGADVNNLNLDGITDSTRPDRIIFNETENRSLLNTALFAVNTVRIGDAFQVDLGLRQNFDSEYGNYLNPSVGFRYGVSPNIAVRGSWSSVQRNPGLDQKYLYDTVHGWLPNSDLKPETGSNWTAGIDIGLSQNLTGQFTYFGSSLNNRLGIIRGKWENVGLVDTNGFEAAFRWNVTRNWSTFLNYTYTDAKIKTGSEAGLQLGLIPYSNLQAGIGYGKDGWEANLYATYYSGARRALFTPPGSRNTDFSPSYFNLDLSTRVPLARNLGLTFYLENLLGEQYEKVNRIYSPGFTFRVGLSSSI